MDLFSSADATRGFAETAKAIEGKVEPPALILKVDELDFPASADATRHYR